MPDQVFFSQQGISVTSTLVTLDSGKTFATANVTSVSTDRIDQPRPGTGCQVLLIIIGVLGVLGAFGAMSSSVGTGFVLLLVFGGVIALGALWLKSVKAPPTIFVLKIASAAGEVEGLRSYDANLINAVAAAITQAITHRG